MRREPPPLPRIQEKLKKKDRHYRVTLEEPGASSRLAFDFDNHDDIFAIIERLRARDDLVSAGEIPQFVLGLKLLGKTLMENRQHPLFSGLFPHFVEFMKNLKKGTPPDAKHPEPPAELPDEDR